MRVVCTVLASLPIVVSLALPEKAEAQEDCLGTLKQDVVSLDRHNIVDLSLLDKKLKRTEEADRTGIFARYGEYDFDFDQSRKVLDNFESLLDIDYSQQEMELIRSTTLPRNAVDAYLGCLNVDAGIEIPAAISAGALASDSFFLTFYWKKKEAPDQRTTTASLMISQGFFGDSGSFRIVVPIDDREGRTIRVTRNRFEPTEISIEIPGSDPSVITIPKVPSRRIVTQRLDGDSYKYSAVQSTGSFGRDLCVYAASGTFIVPSSFRLVYAQKDGAKVTMSEGAIEDWPYRACQSFEGGWQSEHGSFAAVDVSAIAEQLISEVVPESLRSYQQPLPQGNAALTASQGGN